MMWCGCGITLVDFPEALGAAKSYGTDRCQLGDKVLEEWEH